MDQLFGLLRAIKYPCQVYDGDGNCRFQNDLFSLHFNSNLDINGRSLFELIRDPANSQAPITMTSHSGSKITAQLVHYDISYTPQLKVIMLLKEDEEWNKLSLEKIESSRFVAVGQMASDIAHEINNPLTVVLSKLFFLQQHLSQETAQLPNKERCLDAVAKAQSNVTRITKIIKGLRNLARDPRNDGFEQKDLDEVVDDSIAMCEERLKNLGIILNRHRSNTKLYCIMQPIQISQVIINLINNAIDALADTNLGEIDLWSFEQDDQVIFRIKDSGPGVPEKHQHLIMTPFYTTKPAGVGTGLGLSISRQIMQSHGGQLNFNIKISASCFEISLPKAGSP